MKGLTLAAVVMLMCLLAASTHAIPPPFPLEDRVADSQVVLVGKVTKIDEGVTHPALPGSVPIHVAVTGILKGPADIKEVIVLWEKPPDNVDRAPVARLIQGARPGRYEIGHTQIWFLNPVAEDAYLEDLTWWQVPADQADVVAAAVAALNDPTLLTNPEAPARTRLAAAYLLVRKALPENLLPSLTTQTGGTPNTVRDTKGWRLLDPELVDAAARVAIAAFADDTKDDPLGPRVIVRKTLEKLTCPVYQLAPPRTHVQLEEGARRRLWTQAVTKWWDDNKGGIKLYVPDGTGKILRLDPRPHSAVREKE